MSEKVRVQRFLNNAVDIIEGSCVSCAGFPDDESAALSQEVVLSQIDLIGEYVVGETEEAKAFMSNIRSGCETCFGEGRSAQTLETRYACGINTCLPKLLG